MIAGARVRLGRFAVLLGAAVAVALAGCDAGGLLEVEHTGPKEPPVKARSSTEIVNGGTHATNGKYKIFYVLGQPTPQQGVATSPEHRVNGGLAGAVHGE